MRALPEDIIKRVLAHLADQDTHSSRLLAEEIQRSLVPVDERKKPMVSVPGKG